MNIHKLQGAADKAKAKQTETERKLKKAQASIALREAVAANRKNRQFERAYALIEKFNIRTLYIERMSRNDNLKPKAKDLVARAIKLRQESIPALYLAVGVLAEDGRYMNTAMSTLEKLSKYDT